MSAYIESKAHIDALVTLAGWGPEGRPVNPGNAWHTISYGNPTRSHSPGGGRVSDRVDVGANELGQMLINENIASVQYRYHGEELDTLPGPVDKSDLIDYQYAPGRPLTAIEGLVAISGYEYQSCEHPGWPTSDAYSFCDALRGALIHCLPGYDEADTWSID